MEDIPYFTLEDGDAFYVPPTENTVEVSGAVYNESAYRYERGKRARAYLNDAGGPTRNADTKRAFVIHADGSVLSRQKRKRLALMEASINLVCGPVTLSSSRPS